MSCPPPSPPPPPPPPPPAPPAPAAPPRRPGLLLSQRIPGQQQLPAVPLPRAAAAQSLRGPPPKPWACPARPSPQAESPTSEESNQDFHVPHDPAAPQPGSQQQQQQGRTPASHLRPAPAHGSPGADAYATPLPARQLPAVLLSKPLSKMDVACAHDTIGVVFAAEAVRASGLLRAGVQQLAFVLKDERGGAHECRLSASRNGRFCYLAGLGAFLGEARAAPGDTLRIQLASSGRLVVALAPAPQEQPQQQPRAPEAAAAAAAAHVQRPQLVSTQ